MSTRDSFEAPSTFPQSHEATGVNVLTSSSLFGKEREIIILHNGEAYRLRITRQEKLILTK